MNADKDSSASGYMASQYEGISREFTEIQELPSHDYCGLCKAKRFGRWYLLKYLKPAYRNQAVYQQMLRKEFEILMSLQHPAVLQAVGMEDVVMPDHTKAVCLITEWIDGMTLKDFLLTNPDKRERRRLALEIAEGLAYVHSQQIAHRDLKPSNIMVTHNGHNAKIIDFGLADTDAHAILKQPAGTVQYMAPEQMQSSVSDCRNDIYSFGLILDELDLGRFYQGVIRKCLLPIERRYQNMDLVIADIRKRQKNWWGMIALALGLLLTATLLWTQVKDTRENTERLNRNAHALNQEIKELKKEYIVFEDPQVKALCVQHWDTDGDGELSYQEAAAVEHLGNTFTQDLLINTFDELEYFTGLTEIDVDAFNGCANLQSVKIPPTVLRLRQNAFRGTGLRSIVIPSRTVTFGDHVLEDCQNLETIIDMAFGPQTHNKGARLFQNCPNLTTIFVPNYRAKRFKTNWNDEELQWNEWLAIIREYIPFEDPVVKAICLIHWDKDQNHELTAEEAMDVSDLGHAFTGNPHIRRFKELKYFTGLSTIGPFAFMGCTRLESIELPQTIKVIDQYAFTDCSSLRKISLPEYLETVKHNAFRECVQLDSLFIPAHVKNWSFDATQSCRNLRSIKVSPGNPFYDSRDDCNAIIQTSNNFLLSGASYGFIPSTVVSTSSTAFAGLIYKYLTIPANLKTIASWALCATEVTGAIYLESPIPPQYNYRGGHFSVVPYQTKVPIYVPYGSIDAYRHAYGWEDYADNFREYPAEIPPKVAYNRFITPQLPALLDSIPKYGFSGYALPTTDSVIEFSLQ